MVELIIQEMGGGKTMYATLRAIQYSEKFHKRHIYSNVHLKLKNSIYTPFMFLPVDNLLFCMLIGDDVFTLDEIKQLIRVIVNLSRKGNIHIILTMQYYTDIPLKIRKLATRIVHVDYRMYSCNRCHRLFNIDFDDLGLDYKNWECLVDIIEIKDNGIVEYTRKMCYYCGSENIRVHDTLYIEYLHPIYETILEKLKIKNACKITSKYYNTFERVPTPSRRNIIKQILKFSNSIDELESNVALTDGTKAEKRKLLKELMEIEGY